VGDERRQNGAGAIWRSAAHARRRLRAHKPPRTSRRYSLSRNTDQQRRTDIAAAWRRGAPRTLRCFCAHRCRRRRHIPAVQHAYERWRNAAACLPACRAAGEHRAAPANWQHRYAPKRARITAGRMTAPATYGRRFMARWKMARSGCATSCAACTCPLRCLHSSWLCFVNRRRRVSAREGSRKQNIDGDGAAARNGAWRRRWRISGEEAAKKTSSATPGA